MLSTPELFNHSVDELVKAVDKTARSGGVDPELSAVYIVIVLDLCNEFHWSAYAKMAGVPKPSPDVKAAVRAVYEKRSQ